MSRLTLLQMMHFTGNTAEPEELPEENLDLDVSVLGEETDAPADGPGSSFSFRFLARFRRLLSINLL